MSINSVDRGATYEIYQSVLAIGSSIPRTALKVFPIGTLDKPRDEVSA